MNSARVKSLGFGKLVIAAIVLCSPGFATETAVAQSEFLNNGQSGVGFNGGFLRSSKSNVSLTTVGFSAALYGRLDIGYQRIIAEGSNSGASMSGALHLLKPSPDFPLGTLFAVAVGDEGRSVFYGGGIYLRIGNQGPAQLIPNLVVGVTRISKWNRVRNNTSLSGGVTLASEIYDGARLTFSPQFQLQEGNGTIIGFQFGLLMFDKETHGKTHVKDGLDGDEDDGL